MFTIITFDEIYRDDAIFCLLSAKNALGHVPHLIVIYLILKALL